MRAKTILTVLFLISLGVAAVLVYRALPPTVFHKEAATQAPQSAQVLVTTKAIPAKTFLRSEDVAWRLVRQTEPGEIIRPSAKVLASHPNLEQKVRGQVFGAATRVALTSGEPIKQDLIVKPGDRDFLRVVLTPGMRAISFPVHTGGASTGLLSPGDRVDVVLTQSFGGQPLARRSVSETILQDLRVLAISAETPGFGRTVTIEVTPGQAEQLNVATQLGKLSLTLRPSNGSKTAAAAKESSSKPDTTVKATWAGDVSPALGSATPPQRVVVQRPPVDIIRGANTQAVTVKQ